MSPVTIVVIEGIIICLVAVALVALRPHRGVTIGVLVGCAVVVGVLEITSQGRLSMATKEFENIDEIRAFYNHVFQSNVPLAEKERVFRELLKFDRVDHASFLNLVLAFHAKRFGPPP